MQALSETGSDDLTCCFMLFLFGCLLIACSCLSFSSPCFSSSAPLHMIGVLDGSCLIHPVTGSLV